MDWGGLPEWARAAGQIIVIGGAIALLLPLIRPIWRWLRKQWTELVFMLNQVSIHQEIDDKLDLILSELTPNGGKSLRDAIDVIQHQVDFFSSFRRTQLNMSTTAMCETDHFGRLVWANSAYIRMCGLPEKQLIGTGWVNAIAPNQREWVQDRWLDAVDEGREFDEVITYTKPDGQAFDARVMAHPISLDSGDLFGYLAEVHPR